MRIERVEKVILTHEEVKLLEAARALLKEIYNECETDDNFLPADDAASNIAEVLDFCDEV